MEKEELKKKLSPLAYRVTQENGTEAPFASRGPNEPSYPAVE